jgi:hypothetical protein
MKRLIAVALTFLMLLVMTPAFGAAPGSASDPLVSLSYINNTFYPAVQSEAAALASSAVGGAYSDAQNNLKAAYGVYIARLGGLSGFTFAPSFTTLSLPAGMTAQLVTGSTFVLMSGSADLMVQSGAVINVSTGDEVGSGSITPNQRYFCAEDTTALVTATADTVGQVDGFYATTGSIVVNPILFLDVRSSDWYYNAISYVTGKNLFNGTSQTAFSPQNSMTRGMFVTVLHRLAGKPGIVASSQFSDVADVSSYYYNAVVWANQNGIVTGFSDGKFHPDESITREQMAVIISRYAAFAGYNTTPADTSAFDSFSDKNSVSGYAADAVKWVTAAGLLNGSDGKIVPKGTASRAQVAQIILNFCQKIIGI